MRRGIPRRPLLAAVFVLLSAGAYVAITIAQDGKETEEIWHRPTPVPDRIALGWTRDPATTQSVAWRTDTSVWGPVAQVAVAGDGPDFAESARRVLASTTRLETDLGAGLYHEAHFTDLEPATLYAYRVGDGSHWSEWNHFRTASREARPLTFLYVGDSQNDTYSHWSRVIRTGFMTAPDARFVVHAGDLVNRGDRDAQWGEWLRAGGWINRSVPIIAAAGNHEYSGDQEGLTRHWRPTFVLPENGIEGLKESCYYVDVQGVRIVALNSNERQEEQSEWLDAILDDNPSRWTILTFHHPIYSSARGRDNRQLRETWQPIFDKHTVDLVLQGHDHTYGRSNLMSGVNTRTGDTGTVYVVSVSGPKQYELDPHDWPARVAAQTQLFQVIRVDGDSLHYEAYTARGILYDAFELRKRALGPNELLNHIPPVAQRLGRADN